MTQLPIAEWIFGGIDICRNGYALKVEYDKSGKKVKFTATNPSGPAITMEVSTSAIGSTLNDGVINTGSGINLTTSYTLDRLYVDKDEVQVVRVKDITVTQGGSALYVR